MNATNSARKAIRKLNGIELGLFRLFPLGSAGSCDCSVDVGGGAGCSDEEGVGVWNAMTANNAHGEQLKTAHLQED